MNILKSMLKIINCYCKKTNCNICKIKKQCDANFSSGHEPMFWNLDESEDKND